MIERVVEVLRGFRIACRDEIDLQEAVETTLSAAGIAYQREFVLSRRDRPDFMVGTIVVECKVASTRASVLRQLIRYAEHDGVEFIVLVTTCARHTMPATINGKPVTVIQTITF